MGCCDKISAILAMDTTGHLQPIPNCKIGLCGETFELRSLPELGWSKEAVYNSQPILGRASPILTYSHSAARTINMTIHCHGPTEEDLLFHLGLTYLLAAALHPRYGGTYAPPPILSFTCGAMYKDLSCIARSMTVTFPSDPVWDEKLLVPKHWDITLTLEVAYNTQELPGSEDAKAGNF